VGIGTELAINGAAAHAFAHILYKGLLFMGAGAILEVTGLRKLSDMGGLYKTMTKTLALYMVGAFSISAVPLFSGFVSKSMVVAAAGEDHRAIIFLMLTLASAGTFLHTGLKLPYYMFFGRDSGVRGHEPPANMLVAMSLAAVAWKFCKSHSPDWSQTGQCGSYTQRGGGRSGTAGRAPLHDRPGASPGCE
jgi:multicomponent Na+:H+ antiporter subunit D